jgi:hypothetical protein
LESSGDVERALECYQRGIDADPIVESFHEELLRRQAEAGGSNEPDVQHAAGEFAAAPKAGSPRERVVTLPVWRRPAR